MFYSLLVWCRKHIQALLSPTLVMLAIFLVFILTTRLIFIQGLLVPPYADSIQHLLIVQDILHPERSPQAFYQLSLDFSRYYHFGFHALAAWLSGITATDPAQTILLLGQYFQSLAILALYPLARIITKESLPAWLVMCIAGLFLPVPAYASNWGKYPAIASLSGIVFFLALYLIFCQAKIEQVIQPRKFYFLVILVPTVIFFAWPSCACIITVVSFWVSLYIFLQEKEDTLFR